MLDHYLILDRKMRFSLVVVVDLSIQSLDEIEPEFFGVTFSVINVVPDALSVYQVLMRRHIDAVVMRNIPCFSPISECFLASLIDHSIVVGPLLSKSFCQFIFIGITRVMS